VPLQPVLPESPMTDPRVTRAPVATSREQQGRRAKGPDPGRPAHAARMPESHNVARRDRRDNIAVGRTPKMTPHRQRRDSERRPAPWAPIAVVTAATIGLIVWLKPWAAQEHFGPQQTGVATVLEVNSGFRGRFGGSFTYRVRLDDGAEGDITIREAFSPGTRLRLAYTRGSAGHIGVATYQQCRDDC